MAQTTSVLSSRLFQSARSRVDDPVSNRHRSRSVALAARRRETERQSAAAPDLRAHYCSDHFSALLETLAAPGKGRLAARRLFCGDGVGLNDDYPDRPHRRNSQWRRNSVNTSQKKRILLL